MAGLILHHYEGSPFAEKIRLMLGFKKLQWQSVIIPAIMPKPDLVALTGGYRKTPVLQIGADIYCDTALIARVLDHLRPAPNLYPRAHAASAGLLAAWADSALFGIAVSYVMQPAGVQSLFAGAPPEQMTAFAADRKAFRANATVPRLPLDQAIVALRSRLPELDAQLADGRGFILGEAACIADFSLYHSLWFIARATAVAGILDEFAHLRRWMARMAAFGRGDPHPLDSSAAVAIARAATPAALAQTASGQTPHANTGQRVSIAATDYGIDPVAGVLISDAPDEFILRREDSAAGVLHVHFPKQGFALQMP